MAPVGCWDTDTMAIEAVFFDFGGVLSYGFDGVNHSAIETEFGLEPKSLRMMIYRDSRYNDYQIGACTLEEWVESIREALIAGVGDRADAILTAFQNAPRSLNFDTIRLVKRIREAGYRTAIISNTVPGMLTRMRELDEPNPPERRLLPLFDAIIGSGDVGMAKPDAAIFHHAAQILGVALDRSIFTDDYQKHVDAAKALGMHAFHFTTCEHFVEDLRSVGVEV